VVTEAQRFVQGWRTDDTHETFERRGVFRFRMQDVADELPDQLPTVEKMERDGFHVSISVNGESAGSGFRVSIEGASSKVNTAVGTYAAIVAALDAANPRHIQSLERVLASEPFLRPDCEE
jgi:hypothetical protein